MADAGDPSFSLSPRRIVAGLDGSGRAVVLSDGPPQCLKNMHGVEIAELWRFDDPPAVAIDGGEASVGAWTLEAAAVGGMAWRLVRFTAADPTLHATPTIDLVIVVEGQIDLMLEDGPSRLAVGDSAVIQGCLHGWRLVDDEPCTLLAMMVTIDPS